MTELVIRAIGVPISQGSKSATIRAGRAVTFDANPKLAAWRKTVTTATRSAMLACGWEPLSGPVAVEILFRVPRPRSAPKARLWPHVRGLDIDKGVRAVLDSITDAHAWGDDAQVVRLTATKAYCGDGETPGIRAVIASIEVAKPEPAEQGALL